MGMTYLPQKTRYRITLDLEVFDDEFDPHQIDWESLLQLEGGESAEAYVENLSVPDNYFSWLNASSEASFLMPKKWIVPKTTILDAKPIFEGFVINDGEYAAIPVMGSDTQAAIIHNGSVIKYCRNEKSARSFIQSHMKKKKVWYNNEVIM